MTTVTNIKFFNERYILTQWNDKLEKWNVSTADAMDEFYESENSNNY